MKSRNDKFLEHARHVRSAMDDLNDAIWLAAADGFGVEVRCDHDPAGRAIVFAAIDDLSADEPEHVEADDKHAGYYIAEGDET